MNQIKQLQHLAKQLKQASDSLSTLQVIHEGMIQNMQKENTEMSKEITEITSKMEEMGKNGDIVGLVELQKKVLENGSRY